MGFTCWLLYAPLPATATNLYLHPRSTAPGLLQLPTKQTPRANQKTELKPKLLSPRAITRFDRKPRENKKTETKLRATTLFKRPPMILVGGPPGGEGVTFGVIFGI